MAISNCTYYESLVWGNPVRREWGIDKCGMVPAPTAPGVGLPAGRVPGGAHALCRPRCGLSAWTGLGTWTPSPDQALTTNKQALATIQKGGQ